MTPHEVATRVAEIKQFLYNDAAPHILEDKLYRDLLQSIADGTCTDPAPCAQLALTTQQLDFPRWYE